MLTQIVRVYRKERFSASVQTGNQFYMKMVQRDFFLHIHKNELIFSQRENSGKTVMNLRGRVIKKILHAGTKSEHEGLVLVTAAGEFKLQRKGGNPFWDETLAEFEGKEIEAEGTLKETRFIMSQWTVLS